MKTKIKKGRQQLMAVLCLLLIVSGSLLLWLPLPQAQSAQDQVFVVEVSGTVDYSMYTYIDRALNEAEADGAKAVMLEIDTTGGLMDAAMSIKDRLSECPLPKMTFIKSRALSAGAYIALNGDKIAMTSSATFGAALPVTASADGSYTAAEEKIISAWAAEMAAVAEDKERDPQIAEAMADPQVQVKGYESEGVLTLTSKDAQQVGYCDYIAANRNDALQAMIDDTLFDLDDSAVITEHESGLAEWITRLATGSVTGTILLSIGIIGLVLELFTVGFGVAGIIGLCSLGIYFGGRLLGGITGWEALLVFLVGLICILLEVFVTPGFGVAGIAGIALLITSIFMTSVTVAQALQSLTVAIILVFVVVFIMVKVLGKKGRLFKKLVLLNKQETQEGYSSASLSLKDYLGKTGVALTTLRPAGAAQIEGQRVDVVTNGEYLAAGTQIIVIKVEGMRVVVEQKTAETADR